MVFEAGSLWGMRYHNIRHGQFSSMALNWISTYNSIINLQLSQSAPVAKAKNSVSSSFMSYAASIRALRTGRNWTQADLAKQIGGGITNQSVSGWERGIAKPSRENIFELSRIFGVPVERFQAEGDKADVSPAGQETAPPGSASLVFVAIEETLLAAGISESAAAEIAEVVELALQNLRVPHGMTPQAALKRIIGWEVPDILERKQ